MAEYLSRILICFAALIIVFSACVIGKRPFWYNRSCSILRYCFAENHKAVFHFLRPKRRVPRTVGGRHKGNNGLGEGLTTLHIFSQPMRSYAVYVPLCVKAIISNFILYLIS